MSYTYGYGKLEDEIINIFRSYRPDFNAAEELVRKGADLNATGEFDDENMLSEILSGYRYSEFECSEDGKDSKRMLSDSDVGKNMCEVIRFFIAHGFDVDKYDGCYGAQCLWALTLSTYDRYMIEGIKLLFDAGARNRSISRIHDEDETPWEFIETEGSFQTCCEHNHSQANIYEAANQVYLAVEEGRDYKGIDSYETAIGKKVVKVLADAGEKEEFFYSMNVPGFRKNNCFNGNLYFVCEDCVLITTEYSDFWVDTVLPDVKLLDVSAYFPGVVGKRIKKFYFDNRTVVNGNEHYGQPITTIEMEWDKLIRFSINFGDVKEEHRAAYFELKTKDFSEWKYCVVGNIKNSHTDKDGTVWFGTSAYSGGTKVYLCGKIWDKSREDISVIGLDRSKKLYVTEVDVELIENVRCSKTYKPSVLELMNHYEYSDGWWGNTEDDKKETEEFVKNWRKNNR